MCYQQTPFVLPLALYKGKASLADAFSYAKSYQKTIKDKRDFSVQAQAALLPSGGLGFMYNYTQYESAIRFMGQEQETVFYSPNVDQHVQLFVRERAAEFELILLYGKDYFNPLDFLARINALC